MSQDTPPSVALTHASTDSMSALNGPHMTQAVVVGTHASAQPMAVPTTNQPTTASGTGASHADDAISTGALNNSGTAPTGKDPGAPTMQTCKLSAT